MRGKGKGRGRAGVEDFGEDEEELSSGSFDGIDDFLMFFVQARV